MATAKSLGLSYAAALQTQLLPKLGMRNTFIDVPSSEMARYAQGYNNPTHTGTPPRFR